MILDISNQFFYGLILGGGIVYGLTYFKDLNQRLEKYEKMGKK